MLLVPLLDPAGVGGRHCLQHPERLIANKEFVLHQNSVNVHLYFVFVHLYFVLTAALTHENLVLE